MSEATPQYTQRAEAERAAILAGRRRMVQDAGLQSFFDSTPVTPTTDVQAAEWMLGHPEIMNRMTLEALGRTAETLAVSLVLPPDIPKYNVLRLTQQSPLQERQ